MSDGNKLYIGNLTDTATKEEIEELFQKHGKIAAVWIARNPAGFAFVTYEDPQDAAEAVKACDGEMFQGRTLRVEVSKSSGPKRRDDRRDDRGPRRDNFRDNRRDNFRDAPRRDERRDDRRFERRDDRRDDRRERSRSRDRY